MAASDYVAQQRKANTSSARTERVVQRFYVEADNKDGYEWIENKHWDKNYYEKSDRQPFSLYTLYRRNNVAMPRTSDEEARYKKGADEFGGLLGKLPKKPEDFVPADAEHRLMDKAPQPRTEGEAELNHDLGAARKQVEEAGLPEQAKATALSAIDTGDPRVSSLRRLLFELNKPAPRSKGKRQPVLPPAERIARNVKKTLDPLKGKTLQKRVNELRDMLDRLPAHYNEDIVSLAHKALNPYDAQIGIDGATYLGPSRVKHSTLTGKDVPGKDDHNHISNRGIGQVVRIEGQLYTPIYMTVYSDATTGTDARPEFKDFEQDENGQIKIHTGGAGPGEVTLWISIGRPLRQVKWMELYGSKADSKPMIRSFLIPLAVANALSGETVTEHGTGEFSVDFNVDKHYEMNQTGVKKPTSLEMLRAYALPGSLRTYRDDGIFKEAAPKRWGDTRNMSELRGRLGIPDRPLTGFDVFTDSAKKEFTPQAEYGKQAQTLSRIYAFYTNNASLLPDGERMPGDAKKQAHDFYLKHRPHKRMKEDQFMEQQVRPWASQAMISKVIADDYQDMTTHPEDLPETAPEISFGDQSGKAHRGQRRTAAVAMSRQIQVLLNGRFQFLAALDSAAGAIKGLYDDKGYKEPARRALKPILDWVGTVRKNYAFVSGDIATVQKNMPEYRQHVLKTLEDLNTSFKTDDRLTGLKKALEDALFTDTGKPMTITSVPAPVKSGTKPGGGAVAVAPVDVQESGIVLRPNVTAGGGDCFYHSIHEAETGARSGAGQQQAIRARVVAALRGNPRLAASHFGSGAAGRAAMENFIRLISTQSEWVPDHGPAIVADALRTRIVIHRPNGSVYYDAQPNTGIVGAVAATLHLQYTGAHYNSYTAAPVV